AENLHHSRRAKTYVSANVSTFVLDGCGYRSIMPTGNGRFEGHGRRSFIPRWQGHSALFLAPWSLQFMTQLSRSFRNSMLNEAMPAPSDGGVGRLNARTRCLPFPELLDQ